MALAQISPHLGNLEKNFDLHFRSITRAKKEKADLLIFPELSLTGYTLKDLVEQVALRPEEHPFFSELKSLSRDLSLVVGFVEEKQKGLFYNSAAFLAQGKILHIHRKVFPPTYGMFEEMKFFAVGRSFKAFSSPYGKTGMLICYDFLHYGASYLLFVGGSEIIIVISAAPGRGVSDKQTYQSSRMWELMGEAISHFSSAFLIYCNRVGFEDGKQFAGGSFIFNPMGKLIARGAHLDEDFIIQKIDLDEIGKARRKRPYVRDERPEIILHSLQRIISHDED
ncbi:MAG: nitrilase-related carbon-nitrogen hydrolase [Candidatus Aminicenantes bacterium]